MKSNADRELAEATAADVINRFGLIKLPVDPFAIAQDRGIVVQPARSTNPGVSGLLLRKNDAFGILYATYVPSPGFKRFSVAHELGHYFIPGHIDAVLGPEGLHESRAGFAETNPYELEADYFAAALLMPRALFHSALIKAEYGLAGIEQLAGQCETSLVGTAIRYVELVKLPAAIVQSDSNKVDFCFMSKDLEEFRGLAWPRKRSAVPTETHTFDFNQNPQRVSDGERWSEQTSFDPWFGRYKAVEAVEDILGLQSYGKTLTVVWTETYADELQSDGETSDDSWQPRFAYGR